ncbi:MAG: hypothetical protein ACI9HK_003681 [Pirellulaceae bacterium]|jgi:hypothetical protein
MSQYPPEVQKLHDAFGRLSGIEEVAIGVQGLDGITDRELTLAGEFADLPHATLRRSEGGLPNEVLVTATIRFDQEPGRDGWVALEFLAWWIRDLSRSGKTAQMRPLALPPVAYEVQLGRTLKFAIEFFLVNETEDLTPALQALAEIADSLNSNIELYADALADPVSPYVSLEDADIETLQAAADEGQVEAQFWLGMNYRDGEEVEQDHQEAFRWFSVSANQNYPPAQLFVGHCYLSGDGVEADAKMAVEFYGRAADADFPLAMGLLGRCYMMGEGVEKNEQIAIRWYTRAAEAGVTGCQAELGECYELGIGVEANLEQALHWYNRALESGEPEIVEAVTEAVKRVSGRLNLVD